MIGELRATAFQLWRGAPMWRFSVIGAALFTVLAAIHIWNGPSGGSGGPSPYRPPAAPSAPAVPADPASDARLADYKSAYDRASRVADAGAKCEQIATAYAGLTPDDLRRGRNVLASSRDQIEALAGGETCRVSIARSDQHFAAVDRAVAAAQSNGTAQALQSAVDSVRLLDAFDRQRARFHDEAPAIAQTQDFAATLAASDARLAALTAATEAYQRDHAPSDAIRVSDALGRVTAFDRNRLSGALQAALTVANEAARQVQEGRYRLSRLGRLLATVQSAQTADAQQQLIDATAAITPGDLAIATPDEKQVYDQARAAAADSAWAMARQRLDALDRDHKVASYQAVAAIYAVLKNIPQAGLTDDQKRILAKAQDAADTLTGSDGHLSDLLDAYAQWRQRGIPAGDVVLAAVHAITPLDQARFQEAHRQAWAALSKADGVLRGPEIGFSAATKDRMAIFTEPASDGSTDLSIAGTLPDELRRAGFAITSNRNDAALILNVGFEGSDGPTQDLSTGYFAWTTTARVAYRLYWAADESVLLSGHAVKAGRGQDRTAILRQALYNDVQSIVADVAAKANR
jgi:hypothetical protein